MREQDHAAGLPSIALPYGADASIGKHDDDATTILSIPSSNRVVRDPIAEVLAELGIDGMQYEEACRLAAVNGTDSGAELVAAGTTDELRLTEALAAALHLPRCDPGDFPATVNAIGHGHRILRTIEPSSRVLIAPRLEDLMPVAEFLAAKPFLARQLAVSSGADLETLRAEATRSQRSEEARLSLSRDRLDLSARLTVTGAQGFVAALAVMVFVAVAWIVPAGSAALHLLTLILYLGCISLRLAAAVELFRQGLARGAALLIGGMPASGTPERHPTYGVLVALRNETADTVATLVASLVALRWPKSRLQILMICEEDDRGTVEIVREAIRGLPCFRLVEVPPSHPRTKPKALNFALPLVECEFVVLFDAEDRPAPDQLQAAWAAFRAAGPDLACVQAPLVVTNRAEGWLQAHFALEYATLFFGLLPWLAARSMPLPLGGTSNHFRREALLAVGGWDSHNVTEDADLGMRLIRCGYRTGTIEAPTFEAAPERWRDWRNQRTRWMKGYCQSWLVHMRAPRLLLRQIGVRNFCVFQLLFAGMILSSSLNTFVLGALIYNLSRIFIGGWPGGSEGALMALDATVLVLGFAVYAMLAIGACRRGRCTGILPELRSLPAYWFLVSLATLRALWHLAMKPHLWEKTPHGVAARKERAATA